MILKKLNKINTSFLAISVGLNDIHLRQLSQGDQFHHFQHSLVANLSK